MDYSNWMSATSAIHNQLLYNITLPATHDSGAYDLTTTLTDGFDSDEQAMANILAQAVNGICAIPGIFQYISNPCMWIYNSVVPTINGLMTSTGQSVAQQLKDGIRCLDLRIYYDANSDQFYTYHTLIGSPLTAVLVDLGYFLQSSTAEIVYVTLGHFREFGDSNTYGQTISSLCNTVKGYLGDFVYEPGESVNNPFNLTYNQIVTQNSSAPRSRAILVLGTDDPPDSTFLPATYSPPDNDTQTNPIVGGVYSDTVSITTMTSDQSTLFQKRSLNAPFALFLTLTPDDPSVGNILSAVLNTVINQKAASITDDAAVAAALRSVASQFTPKLPIYWNSLQQLSMQVDLNFDRVVFDSILQNTPQVEPLSFIYVDFYDTTDVVQLAIAFSDGTYPELRSS